jgi:ribonuclease G
MDAAFVDIGLEKNAFLQAGDAMIDNFDLEFGGVIPSKITPPINKLVRPGQEIMVQVLKEPTGNKGARVTANISVSGRNVVLMPTINHVGVSRRVEDEAERERLKAIGEDIKPENIGVIMRTAAKSGLVEDFVGEVQHLVGIWESIKKKYAFASSATAVHTGENLLSTVVRDILSKDVTEVVINNQAAFAELQEMVKALAPDALDKLTLFEGELPFDYYQLEGKLEKLLAKRVWLKNGAYLVVDYTEALTVFDVNTGKFTGDSKLSNTAFETNLLAAREIARQLRLRNIGGIIIIDFIDMPDAQQKEMLIAELNKEIRKDRVKATVLGMTSLGLVEMTRKKTMKQINRVAQKECKCCNGTGLVSNLNEVLMQIRRELMRVYEATDVRDVLIEVDSELSDKLTQGSFLVKELSGELKGMNIYVRADDSLTYNTFRVAKLTNEDVAGGIDNAIVISN